MFLYCSLAVSNTPLLTQGEISISFDDIDGYSYTIPTETRSGFFYSPERIDSTLKTMLTMKHVVNYAKSEDLLDIERINKHVSDYILENEKLIKNNNLTDIEFLKLKKYLFEKMSYKYMHHYFKTKVTDKDVIDLAKEKYLINKDNYYNEKELRDMDYLTLKFDKENKSNIHNKAKKILEELKSKDFKTLENVYKDDTDVIFVPAVKDFHYNKKFKEFSDYVFKPQQLGVIDNILEIENSYVIVKIKKILPEGYLSFDEVKPIILNALKKEKIKLKFGNLVSKLTQDEIIVNEDAIISLKTRYLPKKK